MHDTRLSLHNKQIKSTDLKPLTTALRNCNISTSRN
uniref:Uncharacterized protein n=1 Tax=Arundo donax TaxID=35708 RepID=A0A0A9ETW1_ARUDO